MTVARSKCPSLVGFTGIVVQETKNTFNIITKDDQMKSKYPVAKNCQFQKSKKMTNKSIAEESMFLLGEN